MHIYVIVMQINGIVMQIRSSLTLISTSFPGRTLWAAFRKCLWKK